MPLRLPELTMGPCRDFGDPGLAEIARLPVSEVIPLHVDGIVRRLKDDGIIQDDDAGFLTGLVHTLATAPGYVRFLDMEKKRSHALRLYDISGRISSLSHAGRDDLLLAIGIILFNLAPSQKLVDSLSALEPREGPLFYDYHSMMALNFLLLERLDEAGEHAEEALISAPSPEQQAYVKMLEGCIALRRGEPESAIGYLDECGASGRLRTLASFYAGIVRYEKMEFEDALRHFESAAAGVTDTLDVLTARCNIGACAVNLGNMGAGEKEFKEITRHTWKKGGTREMGLRSLADSYLGIISRSRGDFPGADIYYRESLKACIKLKNTVGIANQIGNMGLLNFFAGDYTRALRMLNSCMVYSERMGYWNGIRFSYQNIIKTLVETGQTPEARRLKEMYTSRYPGLE
jgi:tetratricopeptide (TPR) repeat protein